MEKSVEICKVAEATTVCFKEMKEDIRKPDAKVDYVTKPKRRISTENAEKTPSRYNKPDRSTSNRINDCKWCGSFHDRGR